MGNYTTGEFIELFGGLPGPGDRNHAPDLDRIRDERRQAIREGRVESNLDELLAQTPESNQEDEHGR